jgi:uncharacterized protein YcfJ
MTTQLKNGFRNTLILSVVALSMQAMAQVTLYERENFEGRSYTAQQKVDNLQRYGFNDRASSAMVAGQPGQRWEVCEDARFGGRCAVLRPGGYPSLASMGLDKSVSSVRAVGREARVDDARYAPPAPVYDSRRRPNERLFEANVTSVRAVVGPPEKRCWVEREQVSQERSKTNVPATIAGALIGGILGHQIGNGRGNDLATVGGAIAGGAVGNSVSRNNLGQQASTRDVQRCDTVPSQAAPAMWDVTYNFRGQDHRIQMANPPGATVTVNRQGEPRA